MINTPLKILNQNLKGIKMIYFSINALKAFFLKLRFRGQYVVGDKSLVRHFDWVNTKHLKFQSDEYKEQCWLVHNTSM